MANLYYTTITFKSVFKKDNWRAGGHARTIACNDPNGKGFKLEVEQFGKTKEEAEEKIKQWLKDSGAHEIECIGDQFPSKIV